MTVVNPKSISGITSITTASGSDNLLTIHTSDANNTERFRIDSTGATKIVTGIVTNLTANAVNIGIDTGVYGEDLVVTGNSRVTGITTFGDSDNPALMLNIDATSGLPAISIPDSIIHSGDTNTKIRFPAADTITAETGGDERLRITSGGSIGIGTDNPQQDIHILRSQLARVRIESTSTAYNSDVIFQNPDGLLGVVGYNASLDTINIDSRGGTGGVSFTRTGSEKVRIASDGSVGIGTTNPAALLHLVTPNADCEMILESDTENDDEYDNPRILFRQDGGYDQSCVGIGGTTDNSSIHNCLTLRNSTGSAGGILLMTNNETVGSHGISNHLHAVTRLKVTSTGNVEINTGNIHIGTAGKGVYFGNQVTTSASGASMSSELLDHYEEGDWTPVLSFGGGTTGITYSARDGSYTRIGRQVTVHFMIEMTSKGSSTGTATITGLPFAVDDLLSNTVIEASGVSSYWNNFEPDMYFFGFTAETTGGGQLTLRHQPESGAGDAVVSLTNSNFQNDSTFRGSITYFTDT